MNTNVVGVSKRLCLVRQDDGAIKEVTSTVDNDDLFADILSKENEIEELYAELENLSGKIDDTNGIKFELTDDKTTFAAMIVFILLTIVFINVFHAPIFNSIISSLIYASGIMVSAVVIDMLKSIWNMLFKKRKLEAEYNELEKEIETKAKELAELKSKRNIRVRLLNGIRMSLKATKAFREFLRQNSDAQAYFEYVDQVLTEKAKVEEFPEEKGTAYHYTFL